MSWEIPLADVVFGPEEEEAVVAVLRSGWLSQGATVERFEATFAELVGVRHAVGVSSCTAALHLAYAALDAPPGSEVILPSLTFVATASAAVAAGLVPVFADISSETELSLDPDDVVRRLGDKTVAVAPVHYGGYVCDVPALRRALADAGAGHVAVVEDCAHAPGAMGVGADGERRGAGGLGDVGCFSFFSNKNITTGEGGMVTTDDERLASTVRLLRSHGMTSGSWQRHQGHAFSYDVLRPGYNYRLDELRAALGLAQLARLPDLHEIRRGLVRSYAAALADVPGVQVPFARREPEAPPLQVVLLPEGTERTAVMARMRDAGVQSSVHYPPAHRFRCYADESRPPLPVTDAVSLRVLTLPLHPRMEPGDPARVADALRAALVA